MTIMTVTEPKPGLVQVKFYTAHGPYTLSIAWGSGYRSTCMFGLEADSASAMIPTTFEVAVTWHHADEPCDGHPVELSSGCDSTGYVSLERLEALKGRLLADDFHPRDLSLSLD